MINADKLSYSSIFDALKRGDFYASTKPEIYEISIEDGTVKIVTSPVTFVGVSTACRHLFAKRSEGESFCEVSFDMDWHFDMMKQGVEDNPFIRITVADQFGNYAYSRAYFLNELIDND